MSARASLFVFLAVLISPSAGNAQTAGAGWITVNGTEQWVTVNGRPSTATIYVASSCNSSCGSGEVYVTVNGIQGSASWSGGLSSEAGALASAASSTGLVSATSRNVTSGVWEAVLTSYADGAAADYPLSIDAPYLSNPPSSMSGGSGTTTYDSGTCTVTIGGHGDSASYSQNSTSSTIASALASAISGDGGALVTASVSGSGVSLFSKTTGSGSDYSLSASCSSNDPSQFGAGSFSLAASASTLTGGVSSIPAVNVATYHNDVARTGQNTQEVVLAPSDVNALTFGHLFSVSLDGQVYAQPLIVDGVSIAGGTHNVVYVTTENDSVYAIDASTGAIYWQKSLLVNGGGPVPDGLYCCVPFDSWDNNISPHYGVTATPVIDPTTGTIYVVASSDESGGVVHRLHALSVTSGAEKFGGPVVIGGTYDGQTFAPGNDFNRPALMLQQGHVIIAFGQPCDECSFGWVFSYSASTLTREAVFCTNPGSQNGTIWMSGDGVAADSSGNLYFATGNGPYDGSDEFGDTVMKVGTPLNGTFPVLDWFTPNLQSHLYGDDFDQGSGGVLILPTANGVNDLVQAGKTGTIYLINQANMGKWCGTVDSGYDNCPDQVVQEILPNNSTYGDWGGQANPSGIVGIWGSPAYWNGYVYFPSSQKEGGLGGNISDYLKAYSFNAGGSGRLSTQPTSQTPEKFGFPGPNPTISANGTTNGIVWGADNASSTLHAWNATNLGSELYNSNNSVCSSDKLTGAIKFSVPTVANGKVYVGAASGTSAGTLVAYGLRQTCH